MPRNPRSSSSSSTSSSSNHNSQQHNLPTTRNSRNNIVYNHHHHHHPQHTNSLSSSSYATMPNTRSSRSISNNSRTCKITTGSIMNPQLRNHNGVGTGPSSSSCAATNNTASSSTYHHSLPVSGQQYQNQEFFGLQHRMSGHFENNSNTTNPSSSSISLNSYQQQQQSNCAKVYSMPLLDDITGAVGGGDNTNTNNNNSIMTLPSIAFDKYIIQPSFVKFIKLNSYEELRTLIKPQYINKLGESHRYSFRSTLVSTLPLGDQFKVFLRFCKYSTSTCEQMDCLPKSFNLTINDCTFTIKNKYTFAPYDITQRIASEKNEIFIRATISDQNDFSDNYYYGVFLMRKIDHKNLLKLLKDKGPYDTKLSIDLVKKKLHSDDDDVICDNVMKVSLLCPLTSLRLKIPSRSKHCDHVHCFDGEAFISINDITPRWKCPICKIYIKFDDLIIDGLVSRILQNLPQESNEAQIFPDGTFECLKNGVQINSKESQKDSSSSNLKRNGSDSSLCSNNHEDKKPKLDSKSTTTDSTNKKPAIEWITIDSSDDDNDDGVDSEKNNNSDNNSDASSSATIISQTDYSNYPRVDSISSNDNEFKMDDAGDDSDDDCMIVFEKINNTANNNNNKAHNRKSRFSNHSSSSGGGNNSSSSSNQTNNTKSHGGNSTTTTTTTADGLDKMTNPNYNSGQHHHQATLTNHSNSQQNANSNSYDSNSIANHQYSPQQQNQETRLENPLYPTPTTASSNYDTNSNSNPNVDAASSSLSSSSSSLGNSTTNYYRCKASLQYAQFKQQQRSYNNGIQNQHGHHMNGGNMQQQQRTNQPKLGMPAVDLCIRAPMHHPNAIVNHHHVPNSLSTTQQQKPPIINHNDGTNNCYLNFQNTNGGNHSNYAPQSLNPRIKNFIAAQQQQQQFQCSQSVSTNNNAPLLSHYLTQTSSTVTTNSNSSTATTTNGHHHYNNNGAGHHHHNPFIEHHHHHHHSNFDDTNGNTISGNPFINIHHPSPLSPSSSAAANFSTNSNLTSSFIGSNSNSSNNNNNANICPIIKPDPGAFTTASDLFSPNDMNLTADPYWLFADVNNPLSLALGNDLNPFLRSTSASSSSSSTMTIKEPPTPTNLSSVSSSSSAIINNSSMINVQSSKYSLLQPR
ncbi:E3 SUMO-protein ligase pias1 [Dermatophagoides farinae]|uniref:E3 SUMO-protein ligase pias1 n=1 Tax=Dermatophagoides farinae TaxID=6954 RepID=A0A922I231_DERFA|nr:E3 SUMO-protein ligase pias1 [Dermatophagoides farinae]